MKTGLICAAAALVAAAAPASAATLFNNRTVFNAAGSGSSTFSAVEGSGVFLAPFSFNGINFTGSALRVGSSQTTAGVNGAVNSSGWVQFQLNTGGAAATVSAPAFTLIGFDLRGYVDGSGGSDLGETIAFTANTGESGTFVLPATNTAAFLGIRFSTQVTSVTFAATNGGGNFFSWFGTDDYQLWSAAVAPVPEPGTWAMMIGGFGLIGAGMRRRRTTVSYA